MCCNVIVISVEKGRETNATMVHITHNATKQQSDITWGSYMQLPLNPKKALYYLPSHML